jgi:hypothetical protein
VGTLTWPTGGIGEEVEDKIEEEDPEDQAELRFEELEDEEGKKNEEGKLQAMQQVEEEEDIEREERWQTPPELDAPYSPSVASKPEEQDEELERQDAQVKVHRMAIPLPSKSGDDLLRGVSDLYLMLRSEGMYVRQIHSDLGGEFNEQRLAKWCVERGALQTFTSGADPQGNGCAERAVQAMKMEVRRMLRGAEVGAEFWPLAVRHLWRYNRMGIKDVVTPFMAKVINYQEEILEGEGLRSQK